MPPENKNSQKTKPIEDTIDPLEVENHEVVAERLDVLSSFISNLEGGNLILRSYLLRLFLFAEKESESINIIDIRRMGVYWDLTQGEFEFVDSNLVKGYFEQISDTVGVTQGFLQGIYSGAEQLKPQKELQIQRFASLIYTAMILTHIYSNGNKRTSHSLAWSYMCELDKDLGNSYQPLAALLVTNKEGYFDAGNNAKETIQQVLDYMLNPDAVLKWVGYVLKGKFVSLGNSVISSPREDGRLDNLLENSLDGILRQIRVNLDTSRFESAETQKKDYPPMEVTKQYVRGDMGEDLES